MRSDFGASNEAITDLALNEDGTILVAGVAGRDGNWDFALARYEPDGTLDPSFGTGGTVRTDFGGGSYDTANAIALQADGSIVVAGSAGRGGDWQFAVARYDLDGALDATFGTGGRVRTDLGGSFDSVIDLAVQADGRIVAAGYASRGGIRRFALARYEPDGTLDPSFGTGGVVRTSFRRGSDQVGRALVLQPDGRIAVAGYAAGRGGDFDFALARYEPDGTLDPSFGSGGVVRTDFGSPYDTAEALVVQGDGRFLAAGSTGYGSYDFAVARYEPDVTLDPSFGTGSRVTTDFGDQYDFSQALALQADGRAVAAGQSGDDFALARYLLRPS